MALLPTSAVAGDIAVFAPTLEFEQTSLNELRFRMVDKGPFLALLPEWGLVVQAKLVGGAP